MGKKKKKEQTHEHGTIFSQDRHTSQPSKVQPSQNGGPLPGEEPAACLLGGHLEKVRSSLRVFSLGPGRTNEASLITTNLLSVSACISQAN